MSTWGLAYDQYTTLYAGDDEENRDQNHKFIVQKSVATSVSRTIKDMFDGITLLDFLAYSKQKGVLKKQHRMQRGYSLSSTFPVKSAAETPGLCTWISAANTGITIMRTKTIQTLRNSSFLLKWHWSC